jgi:hypothetical protein
MSEQTTTPALRVKGRLMSASEIERTLVRLAHEIVEKSNGSEDLTLIGIKRRGVPFAQRLGKLISNIEKRTVEAGTLDIQFYRDDLSTADVRPAHWDAMWRAAMWCSVTTCSTPAARFAPRSMRCSITGVRGAFSLPCSLTAVTANCLSKPPMSAATSPPAAGKSSK